MSTPTEKTNFQLVYTVLQQLHKDVTDIYGKKADAVIEKKLAEISAHYSNLRDEKLPPIDYAPPETRYAYVFSYVAAHADFVYQMLNTTQSAPADHRAAELEERLMNVRAPFIAYAQTPELMQPGDGALNDSACDAQAAAVLGVATSNERIDAARGKGISMRLRVVATISLHQIRFTTRTSRFASDGWNRIHQGQQ